MNEKHIFSYPEVFFATIIGNTVGTAITQTPDIIRTKIQSEPIGNDPEKMIKSKEKTKQIVKASKLGPSVLFAGLKNNLVLSNTHAVLEVFAFFRIRSYFENKFVSPYLVNNISILIANTLTTLVTAPLDYIHTHSILTTLRNQDFSTLEFVKRKLKAEGIRPFYSGYLPYLYKTSVQNMVLAGLFHYAVDFEDKRRKYTAILIAEMDEKKQDEINRYKG